ncbi:MAG: hypothetical protein J1F63_03825 [Oscillospiraceae bacterium]|nr:hypothetical protein [Oscillospiraceae bacterium]
MNDKAPIGFSPDPHPHPENLRYLPDRSYELRNGCSHQILGGSLRQIQE